MADTIIGAKTNSGPNISCYAPIKPDVFRCFSTGSPMSYLTFSYKNPPTEPAKKASDTTARAKLKTKQKKQRKDEEKVKASTSNIDDSSDSDHTGSHISTLPQSCLLRIFRYLPICDVLRASRTCKTWHQLSLDKSIWRCVALEGAHIRNWTKAAKALKNHGTNSVDFYNMADELDTDWRNMYRLLSNLPQLEYLRFGHAETSLLNKVIRHLPELKVLEVCWLMDEFEDPNEGVTFDIGKFSQLRQLRELKIRAIKNLLQRSMSFLGGLASLEKLQYIQKLSLTSLHESTYFPTDFDFLKKLPNLVELELGDCDNFEAETYDVLSKLTQLRTLRLENGGCWCKRESLPLCTCNISESVSNLRRIEKLELIMFDLPGDINPALQSLEKLQTLSFWPKVSLRGHVPGPTALGCEAPLVQVNSKHHKVLTGLQHLQHLTWGVPIITFDRPKQEFPFNMTTEGAIKSPAVAGLTQALVKLLPSTSINVLIVPVVMSEDYFDQLVDSSDDCCSSLNSDFEFYWGLDSDLDSEFEFHDHD